MTRKWYNIAKAEFLISTVSMREHRTVFMSTFYIIGGIWAIVLAPYLIGLLFSLMFPVEYLRVILIPLLPGLMRSAMFFVWMILLILPLSQALQELRIGQWEILLSNDVKTRDILVGTFLGKIPVYGLLILFIAPPFLAILFLVFEVVIVGQVLIYGILFTMILSTIWLSNLITAAIQSKLGESARGKDIAYGLAILIAIVTIVPMYGIMFFSRQMSAILGMNIFLLFPFTWPADIISWLTIQFSPIGLTIEQLLLLQQILQLDLLTNTLVFIVFGLASIGIGLIAADRIFTYNIGARTEQVTTVKGENVLYKVIRKLGSGNFGPLVVTCMKDFFRKASNLSKIAYGIILSVLLPIIMSQLMLTIGEGSNIDMMLLVMMGGIGLAIIGTFTFGGTSFMESKDQLWIIQSTPSGTSSYVKARLVSSFVIAFPLTILPTVVLAFMAGAGIPAFLFFLMYGYIIVCASILFAVGITTLNPNYENTKSPEHQMNVIITMMGAQFALFAPVIITMIGDIFGFPLFDLIRNTVGSAGMPFAFALIGVTTLLIMGGFTIVIGTNRLARPEV